VVVGVTVGSTYVEVLVRVMTMMSGFNVTVEMLAAVTTVTGSFSVFIRPQMLLAEQR
jgi:hypothetical protein